MTSVALIVGSGFAHSKFDLRPHEAIHTPFGATTSPVLKLDLGTVEVAVIARHGLKHEWAPHAVNYRANIWALRELGIMHCVGFNVVGGIDPKLTPGTLAIPHQLIDYTWGRESSFSNSDGVVHVEFTEPFSLPLRKSLESACEALQIPVRRGVYAVTQGPRLETAAEIDRLERDGCHMVGMTAMPEAVLAREAGIEYAILAGVVNHAAGRAPHGRSIHAQLTQTLEAITSVGQEVLSHALAALAQKRDLTRNM
jgi:5'-methylthioinosine phosphorylase